MSKEFFIPDGFNVFTEPCKNHSTYEEMIKCGECIDSALRLSQKAYESATADLRKSEGVERPYESEDSRPGVQGYNIADGLNEAIMMGLSSSWVKEEEDSIYSHNFRNTLKHCTVCNIWTPRPNGECTECAANTKVSSRPSQLEFKTLTYLEELCQVMWA